jgi:hypothetical protein
VRALTVRLEETPVEAASIARLLRAAPRLRNITFDVLCEYPSALWFLSDAFTAEPVFAGRCHPQVRHVAVNFVGIALIGENIAREPAPAPVPMSKCGVRLRQSHFPHLRRFTANNEDYAVWIPRLIQRRKIF